MAQTNTTKIELETGILLTGIIETFNPEKHIIDSCDINSEWRAICLIDGIPWFGSDLSSVSPRNQLLKLSISIHNIETDLNVAGMFNPNFDNIIRLNQFSIEKCEVGYNLNGFFSDGAGGYVARWVIIEGKSMRVLISNDERDFR